MSVHRRDQTFLPETEALLRQTLAEHAPDTVDSTSSWEEVASQLALAGRSSHVGRAPQWRSWRRKPLLWVAAVAAAVALMGATFTGGYYIFGWGLLRTPEVQLIGNEHLYADVNRSQSANGITITVSKVYADEGSTLIAYTIRLAPQLSGSHPGPVIASYDLLDQYGEDAGGGGIICSPVSRDGRFVECLLDTTAYHPPASTSRLDLTWKITKIYVFSNGSPDESDGDWTISFSVPFHHTSNGPGLGPTKVTPAP
jgi:hypothetical protein